MVKFQGPTAAAVGVMLSAQALGSTRNQCLAHTPPPHHQPSDSLYPPPLGDAVSADSLVPRGPEPVMDRAAANGPPDAQMEPCGVGHIPSPSLQRFTKVHS